MQSKIKLDQLLLILIALILLVSGLGKLFGDGKLIGGITSFDLRLIEDGFGNWKSISLFNRIFIAVEINIGLLILTNWVKRSFLYYTLTLLTILYIIDIILGWNNQWSVNYNLLYLFNQYLTLAIVPFIIISLLLLKRQTEKTNSWLSLIIILPILILPFIFNPLFIEDFESKSKQYEQREKDWEIIENKFQEKEININQGEYLIAFFSTNCGHCNNLAKVLGATKRGSNSNRKILLVFPGNEEDTKEFINRNKSNFEYIRVSQEQFTKVAGFSFPSIFSLSDGKVIKHWTGNNFSLSVRDEEL